MTMTTTMATRTTMTTTTKTASLLPPPEWNTIKFVIGKAGNNNVDSWVFLRAGLFLCIAVEGGLDSGVMTTTKGDGVAGDSAATLWNVSKMETSASATGYTAPICCVILIFLGLPAHLLPVIGLTFYSKCITTG